MAKKEKKKTQWAQYLVMVPLMAVGAVSGVFIALFTDEFCESKGESLLMLGLLLVGLYGCILIQLVIHESGHLVFGMLTGYRFSSFRIGSFMWLKDGEKLRLKRLSIAGTGGQCLMEPPAMEDGSFPVVLYNLGGSLMNLAAGIVFLALSFAVGVKTFAGLLLLMAAMIGFAVGAVNGIPLKLGVVNNDGDNALSLSKNPAARRAFWLQMKTQELTVRGVRPKDMPEEWFRQPADEELKNSMIAAMAVFGCGRLMDEHRFEEAERRMDDLMRIETGIVDLHRNLMTCDRIYIELLGQNRPEVIQAWYTKELEQFMKSMKSFPSVVRTQYVYALLSEKDGEKAAKLAEQFEKIAEKYPYPSDIQSERELMELALQKVQDQPDGANRTETE